MPRFCFSDARLSAELLGRLAHLEASAGATDLQNTERYSLAMLQPHRYKLPELKPFCVAVPARLLLFSDIALEMEKPVHRTPSLEVGSGPICDSRGSASPLHRQFGSPIA